jgi:hypothetical protein
MRLTEVDSGSKRGEINNGLCGETLLWFYRCNAFAQLASDVFSLAGWMIAIRTDSL